MYHGGNFVNLPKGCYKNDMINYIDMVETQDFNVEAWEESTRVKAEEGQKRKKSKKIWQNTQQKVKT